MMLYAEEALFLLDAGVIEIYFGGVSWSVQQAYATLLGTDVPLCHYQVYAHLARFGYILRRHESVTAYERRINSDTSRVSMGRKMRKATCDQDDASPPQNEKRQRLNDDVCDAIYTTTSDDAVEDSIDDAEGVCNKCNSEKTRTCAISTENGLCSSETPMLTGTTCNNESLPEENTVVSTDSGIIAENNLHPLGAASTNTASGDNDLRQKETSRSSNPAVPYSTWDFSQISVPTVRDASTPPTQVQTCSKVRNWGDHKRQLEGITEDAALRTVSVVSHLWCDEVTPLLRPSDATTVDAVLDRLQVIPQSTKPQDNLDQVGTSEDLPRIIYDVFLPGANFKKSCPGYPDHSICIVEQTHAVPDVSVIVQLSDQCRHGTLLHWAVVDNGDVAFYCFTPTLLPLAINL